MESTGQSRGAYGALLELPADTQALGGGFSEVARPGTPQFARVYNRTLILRLVRQHGPTTQSALAGMTGLSRAAVSGTVRDLLSAQLISVAGKGRTRAGRRPDLLMINPDLGYVVGVDLGGTKVQVIVADMVGRVRYRVRLATAELGPRPVPIEAIARAIRTSIQKSDVGIDRVRAVGVGVPGITDPATDVISWAPALGWRDAQVARPLRERLGVPVLIENDVNMMALGEFWQRREDLKTLVCIAVGTGVGAGIAIDGRIFRGRDNAAGEIGYFITHPKYLGQELGDFGALERQIAGPAIARLAQDALSAGRPSMLSEMARGSGITAELIFEAARQGDRLSGEIVQEVSELLALTIANVSALLNPELVVFAGGFARSSDLLLDRVRELVRPVVPVLPRIEKSILDDEGGAIGAVALALSSAAERAIGQRVA